MAIDRITPEFAYGIGDNLLQLSPLPIISVRAPGTRDLAQLGTTWVDTSAQSVYVLAGISAMSANWVTSPASGVGTFTSLSVNPGNAVITAGDLTVTAGNFALSAGNATIGGDLTVGGLLSFTGDLDLTSASLIDLTSSLNAAPSIYLHADGGTLEQIRLHADQGTSVNSIELDSDVGGITLVSGLASADAINLSATSGGLDLDGVLQVNIASSQAAADAIRIISSNAAGGIDIDAGSSGIAIDATGAFSLDGAAASNVSVSGAGIDLSLISAAGRVVVNGEEAAADAVRLLSAAGGIDANAALQINIDSSQAAAADSVRIVASAANGGMDIDAGTGGITIDSTGALSLDGAAASNMSVSGAGIDLTLASAAGRVVVDGGEAAADAVRIIASGVAGGIDIDSGTGGIALDSTAAFSIDGATASNVTVTGAAQDLTLSSVGGSVNISASQAAADAIVLNASNAVGGIDITTGGGSIDFSSTGLMTAVPATDTVAGPGATAAVTINANIGLATLTGFTQAAGATLVLTVTNSLVTAGSAILLSASNLGANDSQMTVTRILPGAGTFAVTLTNNGAAANSGNILVTFWVMS